MSTLKVNTIQEADGSAFPFITMQDFWILTANSSVNGEADITSNWGKGSTQNTDTGNIGTGMTESSGIFTFPTTGIYLVMSRMLVQCNGGRSYIGMRQKFATDGSNFGENAEGYSNGYVNTAFTQVHITGVYDVTNTSTHKIKFQHNISDTVTLLGNSAVTTTSACFTRLGDT